MKKAFLLSSISMSILTACGGGSTSELNETTPQDGSVVLSAGETVSVSSAEAVRAFDFENSPVGSTKKIIIDSSYQPRSEMPSVITA